MSVASWLPRLQGPLDFRYDAGVYYILGMSLAEGRGYRLLNEPGSIEAIKYPPLLPLFAAAHRLFTGSANPAVIGQALRVSFAVLFVAYIVAVYLFCRRFLSPAFAFLASLISLLQFHMTWLSDLFFAEMPFALASMAFFLVARRGEERWRYWASGAFATIAYLLRGVGIALLAAWVSESLLRRRFREAALRAILAMVPVFAWHGYIMHVKAGPEYARPAYPYQRADYQYYNVGYVENISYIDTFVPELGKLSPGLLLKRIADNVMSMPASWGEAVSVRRKWSMLGLDSLNQHFSFLTVPYAFIEIALTLLGGIVFAGVIVLALRREWLIPLYIAGSVVLICLTPWPGQFERYLAPLTPLFALALCLALAPARDFLSAVSHGRFLGAALIVAVFTGILAQQIILVHKVYGKQHWPVLYEDRQGMQREYRLFFYDEKWQSHDAALKWLKAMARPGEIVVTSTPHWAYLKTGLKAVMPPFTPDKREAQRLVDSVPASYLIIDNLEFVDISRRYSTPMVEAFPHRWTLVYSTPSNGSRIYRRMNLARSKESP